MNRGGKRIGAGRKKGGVNKDLRPLRDRVDMLLDSQWSKLVSNLDKLSTENPKAHVDVCLGILEFSLPKLARIEQRSITTIEYLLTLPPSERQKRIAELKQQISEDEHSD